MMVELLLVEQGWLVVELEWCVGAGAEMCAAVVVAAVSNLRAGTPIHAAVVVAAVSAGVRCVTPSGLRSPEDMLDTRITSK